MLSNIYQDRLNTFNKSLSIQKRTDFQFSILRLSLILCGGALFYFYLDNGALFLLVLSLVCFGFFVLALLKHLRIRKQIKRLRNYVKLNKEELAFEKGENYPNNLGNEYKNGDHLFSNDLDVFGSNSLFQVLNRTITNGGKSLLANLLLKNEIDEKIQAKQESVSELADKLDWRQKFYVAGKEINEESEIKRNLQIWLKNVGRKNIVPRLVLLILGLATAGLLVLWFIQPSIQNFNRFGYIFMFNLLLVFSQFKIIKKEYEQLTGMAKSLGAYGELLNFIEDEDFQSTHLIGLKSKLQHDNIKASTSLKELSNILDGFDQINNVLALFITNGLYHFHLHTLRKLLDWKSKYGHEISDWLEVVHQFDQISSVANFSFNHPEYIMPFVSETKEFSAKDLGHPLLRKEKRVNNDVDFKDFQYVLLTGSNMSGKSTFLRSVGVNIVLMKLGAPVCATQFTSFPFTLLTSMKLVDSIEKEESYFQAEVIRLKNIHTILQTQTPCFVLLDEILRGTNSDDKRNGTRLYMEKIKSYNAMGVIATHDIDIAELANKNSENFNAKYFESTVEDNELKFDYRLRDGVCVTPNATRLMQAQGII